MYNIPTIRNDNVTQFRNAKNRYFICVGTYLITDNSISWRKNEQLINDRISPIIIIIKLNYFVLKDFKLNYMLSNWLESEYKILGAYIIL